MSKYNSDYYNEKRMNLWYGETSFKTVLKAFWLAVKEFNVRELESLSIRFSNMVNSDRYYTEKYVEKLLK